MKLSSLVKPYIASFVAHLVKNPPAMRDTWVRSLGCLASPAWAGGSLPLAPPGKPQGREDPPRGGNGDPLQHLAWRIPWTEEPGGLQSIGSQRVRHDWVINTFTFSKCPFFPLWLKPLGMWGLSSPARDWTSTPCSGGPESSPLATRAVPASFPLLITSTYSTNDCLVFTFALPFFFSPFFFS